MFGFTHVDVVVVSEQREAAVPLFRGSGMSPPQVKPLHQVPLGPRGSKGAHKVILLKNKHL